MKFIKDIILPDENRAPFFEGDERDHLNQRFECEICDNPLKFEIWNFMEINDEWYVSFSKKVLGSIQEHYNLEREIVNGVSFFQSPWKGDPYFGIKKCGACGQKYLIYIEFRERCYGCYIATLQGIARVEL